MYSVVTNCVLVSAAVIWAGYLKHLALGTLLKEQVLLVERLQGLSCNLGFLFGFTCSVIQQVHLDVGSWGRRERWGGGGGEGRGGEERK